MLELILSVIAVELAIVILVLASPEVRARAFVVGRWLAICVTLVVGGLLALALSWFAISTALVKVEPWPPDFRRLAVMLGYQPAAFMRALAIMLSFWFLAGLAFVLSVLWQTRRELYVLLRAIANKKRH